MLVPEITNLAVWAIWKLWDVLWCSILTCQALERLDIQCNFLDVTHSWYYLKLNYVMVANLPTLASICPTFTLPKCIKGLLFWIILHLIIYFPSHLFFLQATLMWHYFQHLCWLESCWFGNISLRACPIPVQSPSCLSLSFIITLVQRIPHLQSISTTHCLTCCVWLYTDYQSLWYLASHSNCKALCCKSCKPWQYLWNYNNPASSIHGY